MFILRLSSQNYCIDKMLFGASKRIVSPNNGHVKATVNSPFKDLIHFIWTLEREVTRCQRMMCSPVLVCRLCEQAYNS